MFFLSLLGLVQPVTRQWLRTPQPSKLGGLLPSNDDDDVVEGGAADVGYVGYIAKLGRGRSVLRAEIRQRSLVYAHPE